MSDNAIAQYKGAVLYHHNSHVIYESELIQCLARVPLAQLDSATPS